MTFLHLVSSIPDTLRRMVDMREERMRAFRHYIAGHGIARVVFVGSGSSYNGALMAAPLFDQVGIETRSLFSNQCATYLQCMNQDALYILVSQGGSTRLVYDAAEKLRNAGCHVCSITADTRSPIARASDIAIEMGCGDERFVYRTIGVCSTVVSCWQIAITLAQEFGTIGDADVEEFDNEIRSTITNMPKRLKETMAWYEWNRFPLMRARYLMCAGADDLWAVAREADIKAMEMVPMITRSFELEEIIHGPQNAFDAAGAYLIFAREGADALKARSIAAFLTDNIGFCSIVGSAGKVDPARRNLFFEEANSIFGSLEHLTAAQVIAYRLANDHGRDLTRRINGDISKYVSKEL